MDTISSAVVPQRDPQILIDFSPEGVPVIFSVGATDYDLDARYTLAYTETTFTADVTPYSEIDSDNLVYQWDFGDGTSGLGNPIAHTYNIISEFVTITLSVTSPAPSPDVVADVVPRVMGFAPTRTIGRRRLYLLDPTPPPPLYPAIDLYPSPDLFPS